MRLRSESTLFRLLSLYINIVGETAIFWAITFPRKFYHIFHPVFTSLELATIFFSFLQSKVVTLTSNSQLDDQVPVLTSPSGRAAQLHPQTLGSPFRRLLCLAGLRWRYSNPPPHGRFVASRHIKMSASKFIYKLLLLLHVRAVYCWDINLNNINSTVVLKHLQ
jgi:hypothetical protein